MPGNTVLFAYLHSVRCCSQCVPCSAAVFDPKRWCRYSSYGRHFTKLVLLKQVAQMLSFYLHDGDTVVDFSCGANAFVPLVKQEGAKQGLSISGCSFDIITSQNLDGFQRRSWMEVRPGLSPAFVGSCPHSLTVACYTPDILYKACASG